MSPALLLLALLFSLVVLALGWDTWRRWRRRRGPTCPHCGGHLRSVEPGRRYCDTCRRHFRRID